MKTLARLVEEISDQVKKEGNQNVQDLLSLFADYKGEDWEQHLEEENGAPKTTVLYHDEHIKLLLIYWNGKQKSRKHGHPEGGGLIKVLSGNLFEKRYHPFVEFLETNQVFYTPDSGISYIHDDEALHTVENPANEPAISLHLYSYGVRIPTQKEQEARQQFSMGLKAAA